MAKCVYCSQEIVLVPSAQERAKKCHNGYSAKYYTSLFTSHSECRAAAWHDRPNPRTGESAEVYNLRIMQKAGLK